MAFPTNFIKMGLQLFEHAEGAWSGNSSSAGVGRKSFYSLLMLYIKTTLIDFSFPYLLIHGMSDGHTQSESISDIYDKKIIYRRQEVTGVGTVRGQPHPCVEFQNCSGKALVIFTCY